MPNEIRLNMFIYIYIYIYIYMHTQRVQTDYLTMGAFLPLLISTQHIIFVKYYLFTVRPLLTFILTCFLRR